MPFSRVQAQIAAHQSWAVTADRAARTFKARSALMKKFEDIVDPDRVHPEHVRLKMAESAKKAHFRRLAQKSAEKRRVTR